MGGRGGKSETVERGGIEVLVFEAVREGEGRGNGGLVVGREAVVDG